MVRPWLSEHTHSVPIQCLLQPPLAPTVDFRKVSDTCFCQSLAEGLDELADYHGPGRAGASDAGRHVGGRRRRRRYGRSGTPAPPDASGRQGSARRRRGRAALRALRRLAAVLRLYQRRLRRQRRGSGRAGGRGAHRRRPRRRQPVRQARRPADRPSIRRPMRCRSGLTAADSPRPRPTADAAPHGRAGRGRLASPRGPHPGISPGVTERRYGDLVKLNAAPIQRYDETVTVRRGGSESEGRGRSVPPAKLRRR